MVLRQRAGRYLMVRKKFLLLLFVFAHDNVTEKSYTVPEQLSRSD